MSALPGLVGAGRTETMRAVFGLDPLSRERSGLTANLLRSGMYGTAFHESWSCCRKSRRDDGIIPVRSVQENASLASLNQFIYGGYTHRKKEQKKVAEMFEKMNVKTPSLDTEISKLSGGNQQKVLLARWMLCKPGYHDPGRTGRVA